MSRSWRSDITEKGIVMTQMLNGIAKLFRCFVATSVICLTTSCASSNEIRANSIREQQWVDSAIQLQAGSSERDRDLLLRVWVPVVVHLPDLVCVAFKLKRGALGGEATVCFSRADGSVAINHTEGQ